MGPKRREHKKKSSEPSDGREVHFRFQKTDPNRFHFASFAGREMEALFRTLVEAEMVTWRDFQRFSVFRVHPVERHTLTQPIPSYVAKDKTILSVDVIGHGPGRIYGYRQDEYFYTIWFDRNHDAIDMS